jgi:uncharacterized membrane protein
MTDRFISSLVVMGSGGALIAASASEGFREKFLKNRWAVGGLGALFMGLGALNAVKLVNNSGNIDWDGALLRRELEGTMLTILLVALGTMLLSIASNKKYRDFVTKEDHATTRYWVGSVMILLGLVMAFIVPYKKRGKGGTFNGISIADWAQETAGGTFYWGS